MPKSITVTKQRHNWDCGVAAIASLLSKPYGDIVAFVRDTVDPKKLRRRGMAIADVQLTAGTFGTPLQLIWRKKGYLEGRTGIIGLKGGKMDRAGHWAVLKEGKVLVDPDDGTLWSVEDYTTKFQCRTTVLLIPER